MRRVLVTVHGTGRGGAEVLAADEIEELSRSYDVLVAATPGALTARFDSVARVVSDGPPSLPLWGASPQRWALAGMRSLQQAWALRRLIRRERVGAVVVNSSVSLAPLLAARLAGVPSVLHVREWPGSKLAPFVLRLERRLATRTVIIAESMHPLVGGPGPDVTIVHDGIDVSGPALPPRQLHEPLRLLVIGALDARKGQDVALEAVARLAGRLACQLLIVGRRQDEAFAARVGSVVSDLRLEALVEIRGETNDARGLMSEQDILLCPSRGEWTPLVLMEALMSGLPVIATDVGAVAEVIRDGHTGLLVSPEDPEALAKAVERMVQDDALRRSTVLAGQAHILREFNLRRTVTHSKDLLSAVEAIGGLDSRADRDECRG